MNRSSQIGQKYVNDEKQQTQSELVTKKLGSFALRHIFQGVVAHNHSSVAVAQGLHSLVEHPSNVKIIKKVSRTDVHGVYQVKLAMTDFKTGHVYRKSSTMFPRIWSKEQIVHEVESVLSRITVNSATAFHNYFIIKDVSPSGVPLKMIFYNGRLESVYPVRQTESQS